jgi:seryl-tRNA synthetase
MKEDASELIKEKEQLGTEKETLIGQEKEREEILKTKAAMIGNIVHESVTDSLDEANNTVIRTWEPSVSAEAEDLATRQINRAIKRQGILSHHEVLYRIDGYDQERGKISPREPIFFRLPIN